MEKYKVVDLFAGAGGLSLGFKQTDQYEIKVAFENSLYMQQTYKNNHPGVDVRGDVCSADYSEIQEKYGKIDVVIGGPPCQGFSNANRQKNHAISKNNMLVKQYIRAILELQPKGFVMENVSMLRSETHRFFLCRSDSRIVRQYSIPTKTTSLCLIEDRYAFWGALTIIKDIRKIEQYLWPETHYSELNVIYKYAKNHKKMKNALEKHKSKLLEIAPCHIAENASTHIGRTDSAAFKAVANYYAEEANDDTLNNLILSITPSIMIQRMLGIAKEIHENDIIVDKYSAKNGVVAQIRSYAVFDYLKAILESDKNGYVIKEDVLCAANFGAPQKRMRFVVIGIKKDISPKIVLPAGKYCEDKFRTVRDAIEDLEDTQPISKIEEDTGINLKPKKNLSKLAKLLRDSSTLKNHIITNTTETAMERFKALKPGENFHKLDESLKTNTYTDASRTQNTIYLRLNYDEPCGTVVNVRKSMWIHPTLNRAISVREAARLQTFPDSFVFCGTKDKQYQQVGNAVPPIMAESIARTLADALKRGSGEGACNGR